MAKPGSEQLADELVHDYRKLVSLPEVALRLNEMLAEPDCPVSAISQLLGQDPALAGRLLGIANSPWYGLSQEVTSIQRAVTLLGMQQIRDLVLATAATRAFRGIPVDIIAVEDFWQHSLYCGLLAQALGERSGSRDGSLFIAGLLHDIGQLLLFSHYPAEMHDVILRSVEGESPLSMVEAETSVLGLDHAQVGAALGREWHLPGLFIEVLAYHHQPDRAQDHPRAVALVHIANAVADGFYLPDEDLLADLQIDPLCWAQAGVGSGDVLPALQQAREVIDELRHLYFH